MPTSYMRKGHARPARRSSLETTYAIVSEVVCAKSKRLNIQSNSGGAGSEKKRERRQPFAVGTEFIEGNGNSTSYIVIVASGGARRTHHYHHNRYRNFPGWGKGGVLSMRVESRWDTLARDLSIRVSHSKSQGVGRKKSQSPAVRDERHMLHTDDVSSVLFWPQHYNCWQSIAFC